MQVRCPKCGEMAIHADGEIRCERCLIKAPSAPTEEKTAFDPYYVWLGIPPKNQPPHHYRLLGLEMFESDPQVIENAADRQMTHVRTVATGKYGKHSQELLNKISAARICLLNQESKAAYDASLESAWKPADVSTDLLSMDLSQPQDIAPLPSDAIAQPIAWGAPLGAAEWPTAPTDYQPAAGQPVQPVPQAQPVSPLAQPLAPAPQPVTPMAQAVGTPVAPAPVKPSPSRRRRQSSNMTTVVLGVVFSLVALLGVVGIAGYYVYNSFTDLQTALSESELEPPISNHRPSERTRQPANTTPSEPSEASTGSSVDSPTRSRGSSQQTTDPGEAARLSVDNTPTGTTSDTSVSNATTGSPPTGSNSQPSHSTPSKPAVVDPFDTSAKPDEAPDTTQPGTTPEPQPAPEPPTPNLDPLVIPQEGFRLVPDANDQQKSLTLLREAFAKGYEEAAATKFGKMKLAKALDEHLTKVGDDQVMRYVIFTQLFRLGISMQGTDLAERSTEDVVSEYKVDGFRLRSSLVQTVSAWPQSPSNKRAIADSAISLFDLALYYERFDQAADLLGLLDKFASEFSDSSFQEENKQRADRLKLKESQHQLAARAAGILESGVEDNKAYLALGEYLCSYRQDWLAGLEWLSRGSDERLRHLTQLDFEAASSDQAFDVAKRWHDAANADQKYMGFLTRAAYWYEKASVGAGPTVQTVIDQRMASLRPKLDQYNEPRYVSLVDGFQGSSSGDPADVDELLELTYQQIEAKNFKRAERSLMKAASLKKDDLQIEFNLALYYAAGMGQPTSAERRFEKCASQAKLASAALNNAAICELMLGKTSEAIRHLQQALEYSPPLPEAIQNALRLERGVAVKKIPIPLDRRDELAALKSTAENLAQGSASSRREWVYACPDQDFEQKTHIVLTNRACLLCRGLGTVDCSNSKCHRGVVRVKEARRVGTNPVTGGAITKQVSVPQRCSTCYGKGNRDCRACSDGKALDY